MTTNPNDPVFPNFKAEDWAYSSGGLTKREEFAKAAMQGLLADANNVEIEMGQLARDAIRAADALIAELNKEKTS